MAKTICFSARANMHLKPGQVWWGVLGRLFRDIDSFWSVRIGCYDRFAQKV